MFDRGLVNEVDGLLSCGVPVDAHAFKAIGYREVVAYRQDQLSMEEALANTKTASRQLAKRQLTWLRMLREASLHWVAPVESGGVETVIGLWQDHVRGSTEP